MVACLTWDNNFSGMSSVMCWHLGITRKARWGVSKEMAPRFMKLVHAHLTNRNAFKWFSISRLTNDLTRWRMNDIHLRRRQCRCFKDFCSLISYYYLKLKWIIDFFFIFNILFTDMNDYKGFLYVLINGNILLGPTNMFRLWKLCIQP